MSAIAEDGPSKPIEVLFAVHEGFDTLDVLGPLEMLHMAKHDGGKDSKSTLFFSYHQPSPVIPSTN